eukprot:gene21165-7974_t
MVVYVKGLRTKVTLGGDEVTMLGYKTKKEWPVRFSKHVTSKQSPAKIAAPHVRMRCFLPKEQSVTGLSVLQRWENSTAWQQVINDVKR